MVYLSVLYLLLLVNCNSTVSDNTETTYADVVSVNVSGNENSYTFSITTKSPDKGCSQYANWWEVISTDGRLIYRRILAHSHVSEQPFTRSGGPVNIRDDSVVIVRAHMHPSGYGSGEIAMKGSVKTSFSEYEIAEDFAATLEDQDPLPSGCAF